MVPKSLLSPNANSLAAAIESSSIRRNPRMRVLHVFLGPLKPSGGEVMIRAAAPHFRALGVDCEILDCGQRGVGPYAAAMKDAGYPVHHIPFNRTPSFFLAFHALVRKGKYDIVHLHSEAAEVFVAASVASLVPIVRTIHNNFTLTGWMGLRQRFARALSRFLGVRHLAIGPSVQSTEWKYLWSPTRLCLNWYDSDHFRPPSSTEREQARRAFGLTESEYAIVSVGNCSSVKNHAVVVEAMSLLQARSNLIYLHAGLEDSEHTERQLSSSLGQDRRVRFLGGISDVRTLLFASDLFVMPSLFEGLPISLLEAMGCALPALVADTIGLRDLQEYFPELPLCEPTAGGVARGLETLMDEPSGCTQSRAQEWSQLALAHFGVVAGTRRYFEVYRSVVRP